MRTLELRPWSKGVDSNVLQLRKRMLHVTGVEPSNGATYKWLTGEARPSPLNIERLAIVLEVDEMWLAFG